MNFLKLKNIILKLENIIIFNKETLKNKNNSSYIFRLSKIKFLLTVCLIPIFIFLLKKKMNKIKITYFLLMLSI